MKSWAAFLVVTVSAATVPTAGSAQYSGLDDARRAGQVGERYDGYLGYASTPSPAVQRQLASINIRRRSLYVGLAKRRNVSPEVAGIATGCELLKQLPIGQAYMLSDRTWRRRLPGQPAPHPSYCT